MWAAGWKGSKVRGDRTPTESEAIDSFIILNETGTRLTTVMYRNTFLADQRLGDHVAAEREFQKGPNPKNGVLILGVKGVGTVSSVELIPQTKLNKPLLFREVIRKKDVRKDR